MNYQMLLVKQIPHGIIITLNCIERKNTLNSTLMQELHHILETCENNSDIKVIIIQGTQGVFCTGMDFQEANQGKEVAFSSSQPYMDLLKRLSSISKVTIALVDGTVMAGGVGLVAASDIVIATPESTFTLSEALWGLLPANLMPYLIRRIGFQKAYLMTLTTQTINATEAHRVHLVDELTKEPDEITRKFILRLSRLDEKTILDLKNYFRKLWIIDDKMEQVAMQELDRLVGEPRIKNNIRRFIEEKKFPWDQ